MRHENNDMRVARRQSIVACLCDRGMDYMSASQKALEIEEQEEKMLDKKKQFLSEEVQ